MATHGFKKGDRVILLTSWDRQGTVKVERFTVGSWGKKQGHLIRGTGENLEARVYTAEVLRPDALQWRVLPDGVDAEALALAMGADIVASERVRLTRCLTMDDVYYHRGIEESLAALHEPRVLF